MAGARPSPHWHGYTGRILAVDLTGRSFQITPLAEKDARAFIGGRGLAVWLFTRLAPPGVGACAPEAPLVLATGPLAGTAVPAAARVTLTARSPLTNTIFSATSSGGFGPRLKAAGFDALIITGASDTLIALDIAEDGVRFEPAGQLAGLEVDEATEALLAGRTDANAAVIGSAAERDVPLSTVMFDAEIPAGRGGLGAVMGAKNLKGIVVSGTRTPSVAHTEDLDFFLYEANKAIASHPITSKGLPRFGTAMYAGVLGRRGLVPASNFRADGGSIAASALSGERLAEDHAVRHTGCEGCPIACPGYREGVVASDHRAPEYDALWAFGANLGIAELDAVIELDALCRRLGLDAVSVGGTIATAIELAETGRMSVESGVADLPAAGDASSIRHAIVAIATQTPGFGARASDGARVLAEAAGAPDVAMHAKGLELPGYDLRGMQGQGLGLATSNQGGDVASGDMLGFEVLGSPKLLDPNATHGKAGFLIVVQHLTAMLDSLAICPPASLALTEDHYARLFSAVTGLEIGGQELMLVGERIWNLERLYNLAEGFSARDDGLPERLLSEPDACGRTVELAQMRAEYYRFRGWDECGVPQPEKLVRLGLVGALEGAERGV